MKSKELEQAYNKVVEIGKVGLSSDYYFRTDYNNALKLIKQALTELDQIKSAEKIVNILQDLNILQTNAIEGLEETVNTRDSQNCIDNIRNYILNTEQELAEIKGKVKDYLELEMKIEKKGITGLSDLEYDKYHDTYGDLLDLTKGSEDNE